MVFGFMALLVKQDIFTEVRYNNYGLFTRLIEVGFLMVGHCDTHEDVDALFGCPFWTRDRACGCVSMMH